MKLPDKSDPYDRTCERLQNVSMNFKKWRMNTLQMEEDKRYRLLAFWIMATVIVCTVFYFGLYWYLNYLIAKL